MMPTHWGRQLRLAHLGACALTLFCATAASGAADTGTTCAGGHCMGGCGLWVVPAGARDVRALYRVGNAMKLRVQNGQGTAQTLGCELLAWTR